MSCSSITIDFIPNPEPSSKCQNPNLVRSDNMSIADWQSITLLPKHASPIVSTVRNPIIRVRHHCVPSLPDEDSFVLHVNIASPCRLLRVLDFRGECIRLEGIEHFAPHDHSHDEHSYSFTISAFRSDFHECRVPFYLEADNFAITFILEIPMPFTGIFDNIFNASLNLPSKICLLAPGPSSATCEPIPDDYFVVALNKAVFNDRFRRDAWMMNQVTTDNRDYFIEALKQYNGIRIFRLSTAAAWHSMVPNTGSSYWFSVMASPLQELRSDSLMPVGRFIRSGSTVAGCALQLFAALGCQDILLCGVDMLGNSYFDQSSNSRDVKNGIWRQAQKLDRLIESLMSGYDISIRSWTPTQISSLAHS